MIQDYLVSEIPISATKFTRLKNKYYCLNRFSNTVFLLEENRITHRLGGYGRGNEKFIDPICISTNQISRIYILDSGDCKIKSYNENLVPSSKKSIMPNSRYLSYYDKKIYVLYQTGIHIFSENFDTLKQIFTGNVYDYTYFTCNLGFEKFLTPTLYMTKNESVEKHFTTVNTCFINFITDNPDDVLVDIFTEENQLIINNFITITGFSEITDIYIDRYIHILDRNGIKVLDFHSIPK